MTILEYPSAAPADSQHARGNWFLWAIYLAMSWTWCIGMFLPVLLVRDFGIWSWIIFAVPNVIGAAAVGWINRTAEQSEHTVAAHRLMMKAFSWVTATFQIFFAAWIFSHLSSEILGTSLTLVVALIGVGLPAGRYAKGGIICGTTVFLISVAAITIIVLRDGMPWMLRPIDFEMAARHYDLKDLSELLCATSFGFLLCPHLDLSFHRARQQMLSGESRLAFGLGFGVFFLGMILFSLFYSDSLALMMYEYPELRRTYMFFIYLLVQLAFTIGVHWQQGEKIQDKDQWLRFGIIALFTSVIGLLIASMSHLVKVATSDLGFYSALYDHLFFDGGEVIYRLFLSFYGLLFPAYVWLCMLPGRWVRPPTLSQWIILVIAVLVAAPFFWLSFIDRQMVYVLPGVAIPLAARLFIRSLEPRPVQQ